MKLYHFSSIPTCCWFLALTMSMPALFLRCTAAFTTRVTKNPSFLVASRGTIQNVPILQVRGGSAAFPHHQQQYSTSSTEEAATTVPQEKSQVDNSSATTIETEAKASLSITGSSVKSASFQDSIPYLDTRDCKKFRVLFVLGGPGAGAYRTIVYKILALDVVNVCMFIH